MHSKNPTNGCLHVCAFVLLFVYAIKHTNNNAGDKMARSIVKGIKSKNFTFRITNALSNDITEVTAKAKQHGLRVNMTEALTAALEREVKALQKEMQKVDSSWVPGQLNLTEIDSTKESANANTEKPK